MSYPPQTTRITLCAIGSSVLMAVREDQHGIARFVLLAAAVVEIKAQPNGLGDTRATPGRHQGDTRWKYICARRERSTARPAIAILPGSQSYQDRNPTRGEEAASSIVMSS